MWTITIASLTFTEAKGVAVTQGSNSGTLAVAWDGTAGTVLKVKSDVGQTFTTSQNIAVGQTSVHSAGGGIVSAEFTNIGCGGSSCLKCSVDDTCATGNDCSTSYCNSANLCKTPPPSVHCNNKVQNVDLGETDIDCGGKRCSSNGTACLIGKKCLEGRDCQSGLCTASWMGEATSPTLTCSSCNDFFLSHFF